MRKDFEEYFVSVQKQYNELNKVLEKVNEEIKEGKVSEEQRANFENYFMTVKSNYDRISYMRYLLKLPPKFIQKLEQKYVGNKMKKELEMYEKEKADSESVIKENDSALEGINKELDECKSL